MSKTVIIILGPPAVGKMTVGLELARLTGFKFMHNHQVIEALLPTFPFGVPEFLRLVTEFRRRIFEEVAAGDAEGFIYTTAWDIGSPADKIAIDSYLAPFLTQGATVRFVELESSIETRLVRNRTELRLENKRSKRDVAASEQRLLKIHERYKDLKADFPYPEFHIKIVNDELSPEDVARKILRSLDRESAASRAARA